MSRLAQDWCEKNFSLPRKIKSFENDFSNGYLFLSMLRQKSLLSDEDMEVVMDSEDPDIVKQNFQILRGALKNIKVGLTKQDIASIISDEPGGASGLVMKIKNALDSMGKPRSTTPPHIKATRSLRPKEYVNQKNKFNDLQPEEKCIEDIFRKGLDGTFRDVDMAVHLRHFESFQTQQLQEKEKSLEMESLAKLASKSERRQRYIEHMQNTIQNRLELTEKGKQGWKKNQNDKYHRQKRDLQFELAMITKAEYKAKNSQNLHRNEATKGIEFYERNLKRIGLGGDDSSGMPLVTTTEDPESFLDRITTEAKKEWPSDSEVRDFTVHLRKRTILARQTRLEKARRRRRMLVDQATAAQEMDLEEDEEASSGNGSSSSGTEDEGENKSKKPNKSIIKGGHKLKRNVTVQDSSSDDETDYEKYKHLKIQCNETKEKILEVAEGSLRIFAEEYRMKSEEEDRQGKLLAVLEARKLKNERKHHCAIDYCRTLLLELIEEVADAQIHSISENMSNKPGELCESLLDLARSLLDQEGRDTANKVPVAMMSANASMTSSSSVFSLSDVTRMDMWPAIATLAQNLGKWSVNTGSPLSENNVSESTSPATVEPNITGSKSSTALDADAKKLVTNSVEREDVVRDGNDMPMMEAVTAGGINENLPATETPIRNSSVFETTQMYLEDILHSEVGNNDQMNSKRNVQYLLSKGNELRATLTELNLIRNNIADIETKVVLVLGDIMSQPSALPPCVWSIVSAWLRSDQNNHDFVDGIVSFWDFSKALVAIGKLKAGLESTKKSILNHNILLDVFGCIGKGCPDSVLNSEVNPLAIRVVAELVEFYTKVYSVHTLVEAGGELATAHFPFSDSTLYFCLGQILWLRSYVRSLFTNSPLPPSSPNPAPTNLAKSCPLSPLVIAGGIGNYYTTNDSSSDGNTGNKKVMIGSPALGRIFEWSLRGGIRDGIAEDDHELQSLLTEEVEREKVAAMQKKGKGAGGASGAPKQKKKKDKLGEVSVESKSSLSAIVWSEGNGLRYKDYVDGSVFDDSALHGSIEHKILQSYCQRTEDSSPHSVVSDVELHQLYVPTTLTQLAAGAGGVPLYCFMSAEPNNAAASVGKVVTDDYVPVTSSLAAAEIILSVTMDICGVYADKYFEDDLSLPPPVPALPAIVPPTIATTSSTDIPKGTKPKDNDRTVQSTTPAAATPPPGSSAATVITEKVEDSAILSFKKIAEEHVQDEKRRAKRRMFIVLDIRRNSLTPRCRLQLLHELGQKRFNLRGIMEVTNSLISLRSSEVEQFGLILSCLFLRFQETYLRFREAEAMLVQQAKAPDPRMKELCLNFLKGVASPPTPGQLKDSRQPAVATLASLTNNTIHTLPVLSTAELALKVQDLICALGDVIDARHMSWSVFIEQLAVDVKTEMEGCIELILEMSQLFCKALRNNSENKMKVANELSELLISSGYETFPWPMTITGARGARLSYERRRDELRTMITKLRNIDIKLTSSTCSDEILGARDASSPLHQLGKSQEDQWKSLSGNDFAVTSSTTTDNALLSTLLAEISAESQCLAVCFTTSLYVAATDVRLRAQRCIDSLDGIASQRYHYEHEMLKSWTSDLMKSTKAPPPSAPPVPLRTQRSSISVKSGTGNSPSKPQLLPEPYQFLSKYYFGVSSEVQKDGVPWVTSGSIIDLKDMKLSINILQILAEELYHITSSIPITTAASGATISYGQFVYTAVRNIVDDGNILPVPWRIPKRLQAFVDAIVPTLPLRVTPVEFCRMFVMTLVLGRVPSLPSADYIFRLGQTFARSDSMTDFDFHFEEPYRPKLDQFLLKISVDHHLSKGWWAENQFIYSDVADGYAENEGFADGYSMGVNILHALAITCIDSSQCVNIEDLLMMLCKCPTILSDELLEQMMVLAPGTLSVTDVEELRDSPVIQALPSYLKCGIHKAAVLATQIPKITSIQSAKSKSDIFVSKVNLPSSTTELNSEVTVEKVSTISNSPMLGHILYYSQLKWLLRNAEYNSNESKAWLEVKDFWISPLISSSFTLITKSYSEKLPVIAVVALTLDESKEEINNNISSSDKNKSVDFIENEKESDLSNPVTTLPTVKRLEYLEELASTVQIPMLLSSVPGLSLLKSSKFTLRQNCV